MGESFGFSSWVEKVLFFGMGKVRGLGRKLKVEFWIGFYVILDKKFE